MIKEKRDRALWVDEDTHTEIAVIAARKKMTLKKAMKEIVNFYLKQEKKHEQ